MVFVGKAVFSGPVFREFVGKAVFSDQFSGNSWARPFHQSSGNSWARPFRPVLREFVGKAVSDQS